jgi:hypothetical protein
LLIDLSGTAKKNYSNGDFRKNQIGRKILEEERWFLGEDNKQKHDICYRYVISYTLLQLLSKNGFDKDNAFEKLKNLTAINKNNLSEKQIF